MIRIEYTVIRVDHYNEMVNLIIEKPTIRSAMEFIRGYCSTKEPLVGKMTIVEKEKAA